MIKRGWSVWLGVAVCLLWAQAAGAQTLSLSPTGSFSGPAVVGKVGANSASVGVTADVKPDGSVTLTDGVFIPGGSTSGTATYNTNTITASCTKQPSNKCSSAATVVIQNVSGKTNFTNFTVSSASCVSNCSVGTITGNGSSVVSFQITPTSPSSGPDWSATFKLEVKGQFDAGFTGGSELATINYLISLN